MSDHQRRGFDHRNYVIFDNTMPENAKILELSDTAFRALFNIICYCSRNETDGKITAKALARICPPKIQRELLGNRNLEHHPTEPGAYLAHDYLRHQRSKEEIDYLRSAKTDSGKLGSHARWHVGRRRYEPTCEFCNGTASSAIG